MAFRLGQFLDDLVTGLNSARPYRVVGTARYLLELAAFVHHSTNIVLAEVNTVFPRPPEDVPTAIKGVVGTLNEAKRFAQSTRFNWSALSRGRADEFYSGWNRVEEQAKAPQILTLIDKLPGDEKQAARFYYDLLCDFVHPNAGSHMLLMLLIDGTGQAGEGKMHWELASEPSSDEALLVLVHVVAIPVRSSAYLLQDDIRNLQRAKEYISQWSRHCKTIT